MNNAEIGYFIEKAKEALNRADVLHFTKYIGLAEYAAQAESASLPEILLTEVEGLYSLHQFEQIVQATEEVERLVADPELLACLLHKRGVAFAKLGNSSEAARILRGLLQADWLIGQGNLLKVQMEILISLSRVYRQWVGTDHGLRSLLSDAKDCCVQALTLARELDEALYLQALLGLGDICQQMGEYSEALELYLEANTLTKGENVQILNEIAATYVSFGQAELAQDFLEHAEGLAGKEQDSLQIAKSNYIRGKIAADILEDYLKAKDYYLIAFDNYLAVDYIAQALQMLKRIAALDQRITDESYSMLLNRLDAHSLR